MASRSVIIAGGTGFIGSALTRRLLEQGVFATVLTRQSRPNVGPKRFLRWDPEKGGPDEALVREMSEATVVVNLSGYPIVGGRWTEPVKKRILDSRVLATRVLVQAMERAAEKPGVLINGSAIGFYGADPAGPVDESSPPGTDFLAKVCQAWEAEAKKAERLAVRVALLRTGIVLSPQGGALAKMLTPFKLGLGGPLGSGEQWMSWIHLDDLVGMILWLMDKPSVSGPVNGTAPNPATNREFSRTLASTLRRPCLFRVPGFVLKLAMGEMSSILLEGQKALPEAALSGGFAFRYPKLEPALRSLLQAAAPARSKQPAAH